jgi:glyoxylase-like metal-dependent hydrolase (beta-lactamase superfamily II)
MREFRTSSGAEIYQLPLLAFPGLSGYAYLVLVGDYRVLIDTGSGIGESNRHLEEGFKEVSKELIRKGKAAGESFGFSDLTHILITHGHVDHIGGLTHIRPLTDAKIGVHELDNRILTNYEERLVVVARRLAQYLVEAGVPPELQNELLSMYRLTKSLFRSISTDFTFEAQGMRLGPFEMLHVPGHCAGHVVIRLDDILFSGDHILDDTSPHQAPEHLTLSTGLDHYLKSLDTVEAWAKGIRLTLGGHKEPIEDLPGRIQEIRNMHQERLGKVLGLLEKPKTIFEISEALFGEVHGYNKLLAVEEAGAHVEYLYQRGQLEIANLSEYEKGDRPSKILYKCSECKTNRSMQIPNGSNLF